MTMCRRHRFLCIALAAISLTLICNPRATATWTIVAVDPATGEVGSAGASCTPNVAGVVRLVPGRGVVVAQAKSNMMAKALAAEMIEKGDAAASIVSVISDLAYDRDAEKQQYGIAVLNADRSSSSVAAFTGRDTPPARGHILGNSVSVQGNILVSEQVLKVAFSAFEKAEKEGRSLADRLLAALVAGSHAGGDARCGQKTAQSAYLGVARATDQLGQPSLAIIVATGRNDRRNPVREVQQRYDRGAKN